MKKRTIALILAISLIATSLSMAVVAQNNSTEIFNSDVECFADDLYYIIDNQIISDSGLVFSEDVDHNNTTFITDFKVDQLIVADNTLFTASAGTLKATNLDTGATSELLSLSETITRFAKDSNSLYYLASGTVNAFDLETGKTNKVVSGNIQNFWLKEGSELSYMRDDDFIYSLNLNDNSITKAVNIVSDLGDSIALAPTLESKFGGAATIASLQTKFPAGKYWNHAGNPGAGSNVNNQNGYTSTPCPKHGTCGTSQQTCNGFAPDGGTQYSWQCMGYAEKCGFDVTGYNPRVNSNGWYTNSSSSALDSLKAGDIVRYKNDGHSIYVTAVSGDTVTYTDCNSDGHCIIRWGATISKSTLRSTFTNVRQAPSAAPGGSTPSITLTTDSRYPVPFKCRTISTSKVQCYNNPEKTSSPGYIYPEDDCVITAIYTNGLLKCDCPWNDGTTKTVYVDKSVFINSSSAPASMTAPQYAVTYLRTDMSTNIGWVDPGDSITKVATSGSLTQIIYPASVGKRCAWVESSKLVTLTTTWKVPFTSRIRPTEKTRCYNDSALTDSPGFIYVDDDCIINAVTSNGVVQCLCPWNDGTTKTVYVDSSVFFISASTPTQMTAPKYAVTYLRNTDTSATWGYVDAGDTIYKIGTSGNMTQIIYPGNTSTGWRCAWVYSSDLTVSYTVTYNANGGTGAPSAQTKQYNVSLALSSTIPTRTGYTFLGWSTSATATTATYATGGSYTANASATLYAVWKANQYNIAYDLNGGTGAIAPQTKTYGVDLTLSAIIPAKYGYTFLGWSTNKNATTATYSAGAKFTTNATTTLYAIWLANQYTVTYDANGGQSAPASQSKTHGIDIVITNDTPTKEGYTFKGWALEATPDVIEYEGGDIYFYDTDITLYAIWEENAPEYTPGDINGDDTVNNKDLTRLMKYLSGEEVEVVESALDINGDGVINNKDLTRLMKYLAGEEVEIH